MINLMVMTNPSAATWSPRISRRHEKPSVKCALPGCDAMTTHNGGYCCADHCHKHRAALQSKIQNPKSKI